MTNKAASNRKALTMRAALASKPQDQVLHPAFKWENPCADCEGKGNVMFKTKCCTKQVDCGGCEGFGVKNLGQWCLTCTDPKENPDPDCLKCAGKGYIDLNP